MWGGRWGVVDEWESSCVPNLTRKSSSIMYAIDLIPPTNPIKIIWSCGIYKEEWLHKGC